jgi:hypothetical protein
MIGISRKYMEKSGYLNTQYIIARHHDTDHPHVHIVINLIDNNGKRISDPNEKFRSTKICMELTKKYGLYIASGKENVKRHRLKEPDKTKYEIYDALKAAVPQCRNWKELTAKLEKQGIRFGKNGYTFNGSQIDRSCSYSKIDFQLIQNERAQEIHIQSAHNHFQNQSSVLGNTISTLSGFFDIPTSGTDYDPDEAELQRQTKPKKKKKRGFHL